VQDDGCRDCREDFDCDRTRWCRPDCLACLNDWSHGDKNDD
jgi:hypothetical protein